MPKREEIEFEIMIRKLIRSRRGRKTYDRKLLPNTLEKLFIVSNAKKSVKYVHQTRKLYVYTYEAISSKRE